MSDRKRAGTELLQQLAKVDAQILAALDHRARISRKIREVRADEAPQLRSDRTNLHDLLARAHGDMPAESVEAIFREIFAACVPLELPVKVVYAGPADGAAHQAARSRFGQTSALTSAENTVAALEEVAQRRAEFAIVPIETKLEGIVQPTIWALVPTDLKIVSAIEVPAPHDPRDRIRYAVIGTRPPHRTGEDVTALVFSVFDKPGALLDVLRQFAERSVNLLRIQSHPEQHPTEQGWNYLFFVEVSGHPTDRPLVTAFEEAKRLTKLFKVLGSYPGVP